MDENAQCVVIIVGAGRGSRAGEGLPKQYRSLNNKPIIRSTVEAFLNHDQVSAIQPVIHLDDFDLFTQATAGLDTLPPVQGGASRQASVMCGLQAIKGLNPDYVLIHDAARPFVSPEIIKNVLGGLDEHAGTIPALRVVDTIKRSCAGTLIEGTVNRDELWRAQTPQGFHFQKILDAHLKFQTQDLTDDAAIAEAAGLDVMLVVGEEKNQKMTTQEDFNRLETSTLGQREFRTGMGYDVHQFCDGSSVTLCGVAIDHSHSLLGHSDADVAMHALTDALLGAIAQGDIGQHFPPSDDQWRGASSDIFLRHAVELVKGQSGCITHVDVTIICESPKIGPHREAMIKRLSDIMALDVSRISIKATTTEGLGFTGRKEGIAAQAVATVSLPAL